MQIAIKEAKNFVIESNQALTIKGDKIDFGTQKEQQEIMKKYNDPKLVFDKARVAYTEGEKLKVETAYNATKRQADNARNSIKPNRNKPINKRGKRNAKSNKGK